jgi:hypothetical protein
LIAFRWLAARSARVWTAAACGLCLVHLGWLLAHFEPATMSPDANGYVVQARLIATHGRTSFATESPAQFVGMHWLETREGVFHSRYPAGLPMLMAAAWKIGGLTAALLINPLLASATVLLTFFLARSLAGSASALIAAAVVAAIPVTNHHALDADAHISAAFSLLAGVLALRRFATADARSIAWGLAAGALLGVVPTIRYPEVIAALAAVAWLVWRTRPVWRVWPVLAGAAMPIAALAAHNAAAYGRWWRTGYALTNEQTGFGLGYLSDHAVQYLLSLSAQGPVLFFAFGVAGLAALVADRRWRSDGILFAGVVVPLVLLYMAYYYGAPSTASSGIVAIGNMRFLIPTFPFFAVAGAWLLHRLSKDLAVTGRVTVGAVVALQLLMTVPTSEQLLDRNETVRSAAARARALAEQKIPPGSVLVLDYPMNETLDAVGRWRIVDDSLVAGPRPRVGPATIADGGGTHPAPEQIGKNRAQEARYAGLDVRERRERVWTDLAAWGGGRPVYWLGRSLDVLEAALPDGTDHASLVEIDAPPVGNVRAGPKLRLVKITLGKKLAAATPL